MTRITEETLAGVRHQRTDEDEKMRIKRKKIFDLLHSHGFKVFTLSSYYSSRIFKMTKEEREIFGDLPGGLFGRGTDGTNVHWDHHFAAILTNKDIVGDQKKTFIINQPYGKDAQEEQNIQRLCRANGVVKFDMGSECSFWFPGRTEMQVYWKSDQYDEAIKQLLAGMVYIMVYPNVGLVRGMPPASPSVPGAL